MDNERLMERLSNAIVDKVKWSNLMKFIDDLRRYDPLRFNHSHEINDKQIPIVEPNLIIEFLVRSRESSNF